MTNYVPLHVHTERSLMDGIATAEEYAHRAIANGMKSVAITDHGTISGHREFGKVMRQHGLKPIFGIEAYITHDINDRRDRKLRTEPLDRVYNHIVLIAKNKTGYQNLSKLNEIAWTDGYFYKPRIDFELLARYSEGLIIGSACMSGLINSAIEVGEFAVAKHHLGTMRDIAGDDFYVEVMPHNVGSINGSLYEIADSFKIKTLVTPDCHHAHVGQKVIQEMMLIANTHPNLITHEELVEQERNLAVDGRLPSYDELDMYDSHVLRKLDRLYGPDRKMTFNKLDIHLLDGSEMWHGMGEDARPDSFSNTFEVDEKVDDIFLPENLDLLPVSFDNPHEIIRVKCKSFLDSGNYGQEYYDRLEQELSVIGEKNFDSYFLIVADAIEWAKSKGITVGPGRGSGVSSLVNFALGNTMVDPVKFGLLFFRFIDPSRDDWPDVDIDIEDRRRDEVKAYIAERYGRENVASIATYQRFQDKGIIKDIGRVLNIPLSEVNRVCKLVEFWAEYKHSVSAKWFRDKYPEVEYYGDQLRGRIRGTGMHPSGLVTSRIPLSEVAPIETRSPSDGNDRVSVVAVDMDETADIGLIKLDWLGLKALSTVVDTLKYIKELRGVSIDLYGIDYDDPAVFNMLTNGHTVGVFQCEQAPYTKLLVEMGIDNFNELAATNALVRPGAANTIGKEFVARKQGKKRVQYIHPVTKSFTEETYGLPIYQEQIMLLCTELAGMTMVEANKVRKITAKKKDPALLEEYRAKFVAGASQKIGQDGAESLWEDLLKWSDYGFNKSHAVAYSYISYWTAWLKKYYQLEFMTATLNNEKDKDSRTQYLIEARRLGIRVLLPHINSSESGFSIEGDAIRMGLSSIKCISDKIAGRYIDKRPFTSYTEVEEFTFTKGSGVNSRALSAMRCIGAVNFDDNSVSNNEIKQNLYEYLNLPEFASSMPEHWPAFASTAEEFEDQGAHIIIGIVTNVRKGKGWSLITIMDKTGSFGVFDNEDSVVVKGGQYVFLVGSNRIVDHVPFDQIEKSDSGVIKWLNMIDDPCATNELYILSFSQRMTKAGKRMGTIIASTSQRDLVSVVVFPTQFPVAWTKVRPGNAYRIVCEEGRDGGLVFKSVE